jgi:hypothetical protein
MHCRAARRVRLRDRGAPDRRRARAVGREDADDDRGQCAGTAVDCTTGRLAACPRTQRARGPERTARRGATSDSAAGTRATDTKAGDRCTRAAVVGSTDDNTSDDDADHHDPVWLSTFPDRAR